MSKIIKSGDEKSKEVKEHIAPKLDTTKGCLVVEVDFVLKVVISRTFHPHKEGK